VRVELAPSRLERAVGVIYRPDTELQSHYFHASLPYQFDEYIWFDETEAVRAITTAETATLPALHPFSTGAP
jgi:protein-L-isoaspartate(D-aspartate) O-methyltransferase